MKWKIFHKNTTSLRNCAAKTCGAFFLLDIRADDRIKQKEVNEKYERSVEIE